MVLAFADCEVDQDLFELRRGGRLVALEPRVFDVLLHLLRHRDRVVSKAELLRSLWPGEAASDSVLPRCIAYARRAVGDDRAAQRVIQTVHGRGYRFVAEVEERSGDGAAADGGERPVERPRLFGREAALAGLQDALGEALAGRGHLVILVGEPGIGKTRLLEELGDLAERRGARWLAGRCYEGEGAPPYWPWVQVLRAAAEAGRGELLAELGPDGAALAELAPELRARLPELPASPRLVGEQARFRLFDAAAGFLRRASRRRALVVSLDDLHHADPDSLRLARFLAAELRAARVLLVATYRDVELRRGHPLAPHLAELAREPHCERVTLRGLEPEAVAALVADVARAPASSAWTRAVLEMTEGNPFFVREVARLLAEEGRLASDPAPGATLALPQGVRDVVGRRLDALSPACNELLRAASVLGRELDVRLLERVAELEGAPLLDLLEEALAARVLVPARDAAARYAFSHAILCQTLYEEIPVPRRVALHARAAEALERAAAERPDAPLAALAHHAFESLPARGAEPAVRWAMRAAERASRQHAYEESARHTARALEAEGFAELRDDANRCGILASLGEALALAGRREEGRAWLLRAAELARGIGRADLLARAAVGYRGFGEMGNPADGTTLALLEEARGAVGPEHPAARARVLALLVGTPPYSLCMATRERLAREASELASRADDRQAWTDTVAARYWATLGPDRVDERLAVAAEARTLAARFDDAFLELLAVEMSLGAHLALGDAAALEHDLAAYEQLAERVRVPVFRFLTASIRASVAISRGEFEEGQRLSREALERGRGTVPFADLIVAGQALWLELQRGNAGAFADATRLLATGAAPSGAGFERILQAASALGLAWTGRTGEARDSLEELARQDFGDLERDEHWLFLMGALAELALQLGDARRIELLQAALRPYAHLMLSHDLLRMVSGSVESLLGRLAAGLGRSEDAARHLERGLAREEAFGAGAACERTRAALAALQGAVRASPAA